MACWERGAGNRPGSLSADGDDRTPGTPVPHARDRLLAQQQRSLHVHLERLLECALAHVLELGERAVGCHVHQVVDWPEFSLGSAHEAIPAPRGISQVALVHDALAAGLDRGERVAQLAWRPGADGHAGTLGRQPHGSPWCRCLPGWHPLPAPPCRQSGSPVARTSCSFHGPRPGERAGSGSPVRAKHSAMLAPRNDVRNFSSSDYSAWLEYGDRVGVALAVRVVGREDEHLRAVAG